MLVDLRQHPRRVMQDVRIDRSIIVLAIRFAIVSHELIPTATCPRTWKQTGSFPRPRWWRTLAAAEIFWRAHSFRSSRWSSFSCTRKSRSAFASGIRGQTPGRDYFLYGEISCFHGKIWPILLVRQIMNKPSSFTLSSQTIFPAHPSPNAPNYPDKACGHSPREKTFGDGDEVSRIRLSSPQAGTARIPLWLTFAARPADEGYPRKPVALASYRAPFSKLVSVGHRVMNDLYWVSGRHSWWPSEGHLAILVNLLFAGGMPPTPYEYHSRLY